jgi:group I intron endonuclease
MEKIISGIYKITNLLNGKVYIGESYNIFKRWGQEENGRGPSIYFRNSMKKYGKENFSWEILEEIDDLQLRIEKEKEYIKFFNCKYPNGYNFTDGGQTCEGRIWTESHRQNMRESQLNRFKDPNERLKISNGNKGNVFSEEIKKRMSDAAKLRPPNRKGVKLSEETKRKISENSSRHESWLKGKELPDYVKNKLSQTLSGSKLFSNGKEKHYFKDIVPEGYFRCNKKGEKIE